MSRLERGRSQEEPPKVLSSRQIVSLFEKCGVDERIAKDILKSSPELSALTDRHSESFKQIIREALNILDKEGVPEVIEEKLDPSEAPRTKIALCKVCHDAAAIRPSHPDHMRRWFRVEARWRGTLDKQDWLCKSCYASWYRDGGGKEKIANEAAGIVDESANTAIAADDDADAAQKPATRKEYYLKTIALLLYLTCVNLSPDAINHRKMLVRYITLNLLHLEQLPTALRYLRKHSGIIEQEEFEKECGLGQYKDLWGFSSWSQKPTRIEILHQDEKERRKREEKRKQAEAEAALKKQMADDERQEAERVRLLYEQTRKAELDAFNKVIADRVAKLADERAREDAARAEEQKKEDAARKKKKDKKEDDARRKQRTRDQDLREAELAIKKKEDELRRQREDRYVHPPCQRRSVVGWSWSRSFCVWLE
eukprot:TRINITY_DN10502_c0_g1_i2.p1 TRINITY_DN10502_c0_g1~~TRINITY_DN10502_c0_g1_i2.p1  ORF type:complete len:426 (+),score=106.23 TRINITY_DN10502_c0_g1_i2:661-1938(+)